MNVTAPAGATVSVQGASGPTRTVDARRPVRLVPGDYSFAAHVPGQPAAPPKKLTLVAGPPSDVAFAATGPGTLAVTVNVPEASIIVDGVEVGRGSWTGHVDASRHAVEISARGYREVAFDVAMPAAGNVTRTVTLQPIGAEPPEYVDTTAAPPVHEHRAYVVLAGAVDAASYRLDDGRHGFVGGTFEARVGYRFVPMLAVEGLAELGSMGENDVRVVHWQLTPMLRFTTPGHVRFTAATGAGVHGLHDSTGGRVSASWLVDAGLQIDVRRVWLEIAAFADVHGSATSLIEASPSVREGLRFGVGIPF